MSQIGPPEVNAWPPPSGPPAGWYRAPDGLPGERFFDGRHWTGDVRGRFRGDTKPDTPTLDVRAAVGAAVVLVVSLLVSQWLLEWLVPRDWPIAGYIAISILIGYGPSVAWGVWSSRRWGTGRLVSDLGLRPRWSDLGWGPLVWLAVFGGQIAATSVILLLDIPFASNLDGESDYFRDRTYVISVLIAAVVAAPIVEEVVFRAVMLRGLRSRMRTWLAVVVQGVVFGAAHFVPSLGIGNIGLLIVLSTMGIILGAAVEKLGRIVPAMIAHGIVNAIALTIALNS